MNKFELACELRGKYDLEELQQMKLVATPGEDMEQEEIETVWESGDAHYLLLVDEEDCKSIYDKYLA